MSKEIGPNWMQNWTNTHCGEKVEKKKSEKRQFKDAQAAMSGLGAELHEQEKKEENKMETKDIWEKNANF